MSKLRNIMLLICTLLLVTGCQKSETTLKIDLNALLEEMKNCGADWPQMELVSSNDEDGEEMFSYLADFPYDKVKDYFFFYSTDSSRAGYEVAVVGLKSEKDKNALKEAIKEHVEYRVRTFETYAPDQVVLMENAAIVERGPYVALFVTQENQKLKSLLESSQGRSN